MCTRQRVSSVTLLTFTSSLRFMGWNFPRGSISRKCPSSDLTFPENVNTIMCVVLLYVMTPLPQVRACVGRLGDEDDEEEEDEPPALTFEVINNFTIVHISEVKYSIVHSTRVSDDIGVKSIGIAGITDLTSACTFPSSVWHAREREGSFFF